MQQPHTGPARPYVAVIDHVREVTLLGSADLAFWQRQLAPAGLSPTPLAGCAQLVLSAPDLRWAGIRFQELSLGVVVDPPPAGEPSAGLYLAGAYNSSRLLAALERALFQTPYVHQLTRVRAAAPASITVPHPGGVSLHAVMAPSARPRWSRDETWEGTIFLPTPGAGPRRCFSARLSGPTDAYAFDPAADSLVLSPPAGDRLVGLLAASGFTPEEWRLRADGTHARSRTYAAPAGE